MAKTREIKRRIKAVGNIQRITKTMQMIATARYQAAQRRVLAARPFAQMITELVRELSAAITSSADTAAPETAGETSGGFSHPLLTKPNPPVNRELWLVLTSNRGLCGGYNSKLFRVVVDAYRENAGKQIVSELVGKKGLAMLKFHGKDVAVFHSQFTDKPAYDEVEKLANRYIKEYTEGRYDAVRVFYTSFQSVGRQTPVGMQLLPLEDPTKSEEAKGQGAKGPSEESAHSAPRPLGTSTPSVQYDFSPDPATLLQELLPLTVKTMLFQAFNEAMVSEQIARMVAMKSANDAAKKMGKALTRKYNRARQSAITTELTEIVSGAAALE